MPMRIVALASTLIACTQLAVGCRTRDGSRIGEVDTALVYVSPSSPSAIFPQSSPSAHRSSRGLLLADSAAPVCKVTGPGADWVATAIIGHGPHLRPLTIRLPSHYRAWPQDSTNNDADTVAQRTWEVPHESLAEANKSQEGISLWLGVGIEGFPTVGLPATDRQTEIQQCRLNTSIGPIHMALFTVEDRLQTNTFYFAAYTTSESSISLEAIGSAADSASRVAQISALAAVEPLH